MKHKVFFVISVFLMSLCGLIKADELQLTVLPLKAVENEVPTHYQTNYNKMRYVTNDPFNYDPTVYDNPVKTTPAPIQSQFGDSTVFVPASIIKNSYYMNGAKITDKFLYDFDYANCALLDCEIPDGQSLKYLDVWVRKDHSNIRNQNLVATFYNKDGLIVESKKFDCSLQEADYPSFKRIDLSEDGITDNLLTEAVRIKISHDSVHYTDFLVMAEVRAVTETVDYSAANTPTFSTETTSGSIEINLDLKIGIDSKYRGTAYLVPEGTAKNIATIRNVAVDKFVIYPDSTYNYGTSHLEFGKYQWYFLDYGNNLSEASATVDIYEDVTAPVVTTDMDSYVYSSWIKITTNEVSTAYIIDISEDIIADSIKANAYKKIPLESNGVINYMGTYRLNLGDYYLVVLDNSSNISEKKKITITELERVEYEEYPILNATSIGPHYGVGGVNADVDNIYDDGFEYDPNEPNKNYPDQLWKHGGSYDPLIDTAVYYPKEKEDGYFEISFEIPVNQSIEVLDFWGRGDVTANGGARQDNILITLSNSQTGESWTSPLWSGITNAKEDPKAFGRFHFSTAEVEPQSLLKTADRIKFGHPKGYGDGLSIFEVRVGGPTWINSVPVSNPGVDQTVKPGTLVTLDGSASYDPDSATQTITYTWIPPSGITLSDKTVAKPTFTAPQVTSAKTYTFRLMVEDSDGAKSKRESVKVVVDPDAAALNSLENKNISVYPNPSNGTLFVDLNEVKATCTISIIDITGKQIFTQQISGGKIQALNLSELVSGICFLHIDSEESTTVKRIIIK